MSFGQVAGSESVLPPGGPEPPPPGPGFPPVANPDHFTFAPDAPIRIRVADLLANDTAAPGVPLTVELLDSPANRAAIAAGRSPVVDATWVAHNPTHQSFVGSRLIHHHIDQGAIATGLPEPVHRAWHGILHPVR
jgi:hypothetical protein